ncbi:MAG TPA: hypothetical protein DIU39_09930 [Flavobacteriales bacterium]|nr:hypothetical protein [Flavobacteriales bacterium]
MKNAILLFIVILGINLNAFSQSSTIKGVVKDESGNRVPYATVYLDVNGSPQHGTTTDENGVYKISGLTPGKYTVVIQFLGYQTKKYTDITVTANETAYVNATLQSAAEDLPVIDIICYDCERPLIKPSEPSVEMLTPTDFEHNPNINEPKMMLRALGGIIVAENGKDVYVRGSRPENTQIIVDGVKSPDGEMHIPGQAIGSMKVYTGGVPAIYGDVLGGVVVVNTKGYFDLVKMKK